MALHTNHLAGVIAAIDEKMGEYSAERARTAAQQSDYDCVFPIQNKLLMYDIGQDSRVPNDSGLTITSGYKDSFKDELQSEIDGWLSDIAL
jgi:hypothetical protein